jgi:hypothetical protein
MLFTTIRYIKFSLWYKWVEEEDQVEEDPEAGHHHLALQPGKLLQLHAQCQLKPRFNLKYNRRAVVYFQELVAL